jgi:hypothetical protein
MWWRCSSVPGNFQNAFKPLAEKFLRVLGIHDLAHEALLRDSVALLELTSTTAPIGYARPSGKLLTANLFFEHGRRYLLVSARVPA